MKLQNTISVYILLSIVYMQPQLLKPVHGDTLNYIHILFEWTQSSGAQEYQLQIAESPEFEEPMFELADSTLSLVLSEFIEWESEYYWRIRPININDEFGDWTDTHTFQTATLPMDIPTLNTITYFPELVFPGITILDQLGHGLIFAIDLDGNPIWYLDSEPIFDNGMQYQIQFTGFLPNGNIIGIADGREVNMPGRAYEMNIDNELIWESPDNLESFGVHHDVIQRDNGNTMAITSSTEMLPVPEGDWPIEPPDSILWQGDRIVEWDVDGNEVWSWNTFDYYNLEDWNYYILLISFGTGIYDWTHSNAIWYDDVDEVVYISVRYMSRITKIDYATGNIIWNMGMEMPSGDVEIGTNLDFSFQHSVKILENRNIMIYDNGNNNEIPISRGLEISINETDTFPSAEIVWEYILPDSLNSDLMSDCDRLTNGNSLLTSTTTSHLLEVSPDSQKVWEVIPNQEFSTYRGERVSGLYPQIFSIIQPDFVDGINGPTVFLPIGENSLTYTIYNEGWLDEIYEYTLIDEEGWFTETGTIEINSESHYQFSFAGNVAIPETINTITFDLTPLNAPELIQSLTLFLSLYIPGSGDLNNDGGLDVLDVIIAVDIIIEQIEPEEFQFEVADINNDLSVDIFDIILMINIILGN